MHIVVILRQGDAFYFKKGRYRVEYVYFFQSSYMMFSFQRNKCTFLIIINLLLLALLTTTTTTTMITYSFFI